MAENEKAPSPAAGFPEEFLDCWSKLPNKSLFFSLLAAWLLLFHLLGNATFGYIHSGSLFTWMSVAYTGNDWEEGHGILIPFVVLVLFWWKREQLLAVDFRAWWPGLLLLAGAVLLHMLGYMVQQPRLSIMALYLGIYAIMGLAWGPAWMRASFFPMFLLGFCIPFATLGGPVNALTFHLRILVAKIVAVVGGDLLGMDVVREGTQLVNASHTFGYDVAAACSGLRSLVAIMALSTIFAFINFDTGWKRLLLIASGVPLAIFGNVARMFCIIIAAEFDGQEGGNFVHDNWFFSLLPYLPAFLGLILIGHWLRERPAPPPQSLAPKPV